MHRQSNKPLVTVIIPAYNAKKYLKECLDSVLRQTYSNLQILLINDGSTDTTLSIFKEYKMKDTRIEILTQNNGGVSSSRNLGVTNAKGEYVTFVDSDDWLEYDAIENMVNVIVSEDSDCVRTNYYSNNKITKTHLTPGQYHRSDMLKLLQVFLSGKEQCYTWLLMIKIEKIAKIMPFNEDVHFLEDKIFYTVMLTNLDSISISEVGTYHYRMNANSATKSALNYYKNIDYTVKAYLSILSILKFNNLNLEDAARYSHAHIINGYLYLNYKNYGPETLLKDISALTSNNDFLSIISDLPLRYINVKYLYTKIICDSIVNKNNRILLATYKARSFFVKITSLRLR